MRKRIGYLDVAKGIGIVCVIIGHMGIEKIMEFVNLFHMPLFFLISGYLLNMNQDLHAYMKKKVRQLLIPYGFTCIGICILSMLKSWVLAGGEQIWRVLLKSIVSSIYGAGADYNLPWGIEEIGAIWFLLALIWALFIVKCFASREGGYIWILSIAYISYVTSRYIWLPFSVQAGGMVCVFVYVGYLIRRNQEKMEEKEFVTNYFLLGFGIFLVWFEYKFELNMVVATNGYSDVLFNMISAVIICYVIVYIANFLDKKSRGLRKIFIFLGENSLSILCFHLIEINMLPWNRIYGVLDVFSIVKGVQYVIAFLVRMLFPTACAWVMVKIKVFINNVDRNES